MSEQMSSRSSCMSDTPEQMSTVVASTSQQSPVCSRKSKTPKVCGVCGDRAKSYHFGGLSCDSCKAFFRRSVQNDAYKNFQCPYEGTCLISVSSRKCCQQCRFLKCLSIGMEKNWVMSGEERTEMLKTRMEKKQKIQEEERQQKVEKRGLIPYEPDIDEIHKYMKSEETEIIKSIVYKYEKAYKDIPYNKDLIHFNEGRPSVQIINMFTTIIHRFAYFLRMIDDFAQLSQEDQLILLRGGILEMCLIRSALCFDQKNNCWPPNNWEIYKDAPQLRVEDMKKLVSSDLYDMHMKFISSIQELNPDEACLMMLLLIVLFAPERYGLQAVQHVGASQEKYLLLLRKYMDWRYGAYNSSTLYPKLLTKLTDLRELNDLHTEYNLRLAKKEVEEIQLQLGNLNLNPYTQWDVLNVPSSSKMFSPQDILSKDESPATKHHSASSTSIRGDTETENAEGEAKFAKGMATEKGIFQEDMSKLTQFGFLQMMQKSIMRILSSPTLGTSQLTPDPVAHHAQYTSPLGMGNIEIDPSMPQTQSINREKIVPISYASPSIPTYYSSQAQLSSHTQTFTSSKVEDSQQHQHYRPRAENTKTVYPTESAESSYHIRHLNPPEYHTKTQEFHPQFDISQVQESQPEYFTKFVEMCAEYKTPRHESQHSIHPEEHQEQYQTKHKNRQDCQTRQEPLQVMVGNSESLQIPLTLQHQGNPPTSQQPVLHMTHVSQEEKGKLEVSDVHSSQMDSLNLSQLEQFKSILEQLTSCDNSQQIEQIKHIIGPDLVSQFQQKLIGQSAIPGMTQTGLESTPAYHETSSTLTHMSSNYLQLSHNVAPQIQPLHSLQLAADHPPTSSLLHAPPEEESLQSIPAQSELPPSLSPSHYIRLSPRPDAYMSQTPPGLNPEAPVLNPAFQHYSYTQHLLADLDNPEISPVSPETGVNSEQYME